jgi:hypothetical protein
MQRYLLTAAAWISWVLAFGWGIYAIIMVVATSDGSRDLRAIIMFLVITLPFLMLLFLGYSIFNVIEFGKRTGVWPMNGRRINPEWKFRNVRDMANGKWHQPPK